jgi:hypothetical protein
MQHCHHHSEVRQRDNDGLYEVVRGDTIAGPFPTIAFAITVASDAGPERKPAAKFRRLKTFRGVLNACAA